MRPAVAIIDKHSGSILFHNPEGEATQGGDRCLRVHRKRTNRLEPVN